MCRRTRQSIPVFNYYANHAQIPSFPFVGEVKRADVQTIVLETQKPLHTIYGQRLFGVSAAPNVMREGHCRLLGTMLRRLRENRRAHKYEQAAGRVRRPADETSGQIGVQITVRHGGVKVEENPLTLCKKS